LGRNLVTASGGHGPKRDDMVESLASIAWRREHSRSDDKPAHCASSWRMTDGRSLQWQMVRLIGPPVG
jgi:hypothetical protein